MVYEQDGKLEQHGIKFLFAGTEVIQVRAIDRDSESLEHPNSGAGKIVYSIVSTHNHFKIDSETGWLSTNKVRSLFCVLFDILKMGNNLMKSKKIWERGNRKFFFIFLGFYKLNSENIFFSENFFQVH